MGVTNHDFTGNLDQALKDFETIARISEDRGDPWRFWQYYVWHGKILRRKGMYQEEEALYRRGLEIFSEERYRKEFFFHWTISAVLRGDSVIASKLMEEYRETKEILGELEDYEFQRCAIFYRGRDYERAETEVRSFIEKFPDQIRGKYLLARILITGDLDPEEGLELINAGLKTYPENLTLLDWKAWALHRMGRDLEALELFEKNEEQDDNFNLIRHQRMQEVREALAAETAL